MNSFTAIVDWQQTQVPLNSWWKYDVIVRCVYSSSLSYRGAVWWGWASVLRVENWLIMGSIFTGLGGGAVLFKRARRKDAAWFKSWNHDVCDVQQILRYGWKLVQRKRNVKEFHLQPTSSLALQVDMPASLMADTVYQPASHLTTGSMSRHCVPELSWERLTHNKHTTRIRQFIHEAFCYT